MKHEKLVLIDPGIFCEGMHVKSSIYYLYDGSYVLLCRDVIFTSTLMERLYNVVNGTNGVYIEEASYEEVWNESLRQHTQDSSAYIKECQKTREQYDYVLSETMSFLGEIAPKSAVPLRMADDITENIAEKLGHTDHSMLLHCVNMIYEADNYLYTHCVNVATLNGMIGKWMELPAQEVRRLIKIGLLHDLGKLKVPPQILNKPGRLTEREFAEVKKHPVFSYEMIKSLGEHDMQILQGVRQHHEKFNGTGYPDGLSHTNISLAARITTISDIYDAMVSTRCYKKASTPFEILALFKANRYSDLDLQVVNVFLQNITYLFIGLKVRLSDGEVGEVMFVRPTDYENPVVKVGQKVFATNKRCSCVSLLEDFGGVG